MKNLVFLINSLQMGGGEKVLLTLAIELSNQGYKITILCLERNIFYDIPKSINIVFLSKFTGRETGVKKFLTLPLLAFKLSQYIKKHDVKIVKSHLYRANFVNLLSKLFFTKHKSIIVNHGTMSLYFKEGFLGKVNLFLIKKLYPLADLIILISQSMKQDMQNIFNFKNQSVVINNPYNIKEITNKSNEKVTDFLFKDDKIYLISVGRLIELKHYHIILESLTHLNNNIELILLGDGNEKDNLIKLAKKYDLIDRVHFLGQVLNPFKYIKNSNIFISSSTSEGFPNVLIEALSCSIPIIFTDCKSGPREILAPKTKFNFVLKNDIELAEYGVLFPIDNVNFLVKAIKLLISDEILRRNYINRGKQRADNFDVSTIVKLYKKTVLS